jgi:hypothetical protein
MTQQGTSSGQGRCPPLRCSYLPRRISAGSRYPSLAPAMAGTDLLIDIVRAVAKGNQELFRRALEALITEKRLKQHHVLADLLLEIRPKRRLGDLPLPTDIRQVSAPPNSNPATACFPSTTLSLHKGWWPAT